MRREALGRGTRRGLWAKAASGTLALPSATLLFGALLWWAGPVRAQDAGTCDPSPQESGPVEVSPASQAQRVALNAWVQVRYSPGALAGVLRPDELIEVSRCASLTGPCSSDPVSGRVQAIGDVLFFVPDSPWLATARYAGIARGLDFDLEFGFQTGERNDDLAPQFNGVTDVSTARTPARCESPDGGYRVDVRFQPATNTDGSPGSLEYLLYLVRGPTVDAPELRSRLRNFSTGSRDEITMAFVLSPEEASAPVCIVVHAVDGVGHVDSSMSPYCFEPVSELFFEGLCSAGGDPAPGFGALVVVGWLLRRRRLRHL